MDRPDHVAMQTKLWSTDAEWQPSPNEEALELFKLDQNGKQILPTGAPELVKPVFNLRQNYDDIKRNVEKMRNFLKHGQHEWWSQLFENPESLFSATEDWYLEVLSPLERDVPVQQNTESPESPMQLAMVRERNALQVYTGKRKKPQVKTNETTPIKNKKHIRPELGYMVTVQQDGELYVGKVSKIGNTTLDIVLFTGTLCGSWAPCRTQNGRYYTKVFAKDLIKENMIFYLTANDKLPACIKHILSKFIK